MKSFSIFSLLFQILIWGLFIAQPYLNKPPHIDHYLLNFHIEHIGEWCLYIFFFYLNYFFLIPRFLIKNKIGKYFSISLVIFILVFILVNILEFICFGIPKDGKLISFFSLLPLAAIYSLSIALRMLSDWLLVKSQREELTREKKNAELAMMRLQVSPHFLFNSLNNINALVRFNPAEAEKYIVQLSGMMRYVLKVGNGGETSLADEIDYLQDYISLQKLRLPENFNISFEVKGETKDMKIEPLLLIGFIENTFKHGVSGKPVDFIRIEISIKNDLLLMNASNSVAPESFSKDEVSGIGIKNAIGRMKLIYPGKYVLDIANENGVHTVNLKLELQ